ncbi:MAG: zinc-ribbon domain-containing protein [Chloroflexi bacterium]|nr:zinc-ribbon domain-containing protein [Chloroflexota bacterium]
MQCSSCGASNPSDQRFCGRCGAPLDNVPPAPPIATSANKKTKTWLFVVVGGAALCLLCLCFIGAIILLNAFYPSTSNKTSSRASSTSSSQSSRASSASKSSSASSASTLSSASPPSPTLSPASNLTAFAQSVGSKYELAVNSAIVSGTIAVIDYKMNVDNFNELLVIQAQALTFRNLVPSILQTMPNVSAVDCHVTADFRNMYGNKVADTAIRFVVTRETANKMDWKGYRSQNLDKILVGKGDVFYVHPAIKTGWTQFQAQ